MAHTALHEVDQGGAFKRTESQFRNWIQPGGKFEPEADRYHLYVSYACPWASRCIAIRAIKGLEDVIGLSVVHPTWGRTKPDVAGDEHTGWLFKNPGDPPFANPAGKGSFECDAALQPDTVNNAKTIREVYELANDTHGKYSVPVLWDKKLKTIVNNESSEIVQMFSKQFNQWAKKPEIDICPDDLAALRKETIDWVVPNICNGVYRCGFAQSQAAYDEACVGLYAHLDKAEELLSRQRYLCGTRFTDADIFLFVTLIRFDEVYVAYFRTCKKLIREYPNLFNFVKDVYQVPGVAASVNMQHIKTHYFTSHPHLNSFAIVPHGPGIDYSSPHDRDRF